ncbi:prepilin-type N-terminal cleavage/methylation domain-containing protein [Myxococcus sp. MxC21-1]|uniref:prepilin-type N-terminal cleavage/methylation domain-containing protein n=1 Tax=Myxococcus sp. MxC21-1 TaxID=3041439 RepID=UPI0029300E9E|nr:prepilin-type N-terminal cleavage/methylation domain-containing protein [Myxococcus sp. MxC21-1]WNZ63575.1 prepilin-type N-terminal cleavage/methylation domain-containing protein [Myxococcus sp. MxC21-1]
MSRRDARGMTLLEVSIVLAIIAVLAALAYAGYAQLSARAGPQNAAADLSGALAEARARAVDRQADVWLIIYPDINPEGQAGAGNGAWFLLEDRLRDFGAAAGAGGQLSFDTFSPPLAIQPSADQGRLMDSMYLDRYSQRTVRFGASGNLEWTGIFEGLAPTDCFCSGAPRRGAIVFRSDGSARFVNGAGQPVIPAGNGTVNRAASLALLSTDGQREYLFAVSAPVGFVDMRVNK